MQQNRRQTIVLIPAYKPTEKMISVCKALYETGISVLCIDDGSGEMFDQIFWKAERYARVLRYRKNRGKGSALKYGLQVIASDPAYHEFQYVVTADADGQHIPDDICRVADAVSQYGGLVLGVRTFSGKVPLRSRIGNAITRRMFRFASEGGNISDTQTGLRAFPISDLDVYLQTEGEKYEYEMNVLFAVVKREINVHEISIATIYEEKNKNSCFRPIVDSWRIYRAIFAASQPIKYVLSSLGAFLIDYVVVICFSRILQFHGAMEFAVWIAWCISSFFNFYINRTLVFKSRESFFWTLGQYYGLAVLVFFMKNLLLLEAFVRILIIPLPIAKIVVEIIFFCGNYLIQKRMIFVKKGNHRRQFMQGVK